MTLDDRVARFVRELAAAAEAVGAGLTDEAVALPDDGGDPELAALSQAFEQMVGHIRERRRQTAERDAAFRSALNRLGDALTVTHDRSGIISAVLETSALSVAAERGVFYASVPGNGGLRAMSDYGFDADNFELAPGDGVAGDAAVHDHVAEGPDPVPLSGAEPDVNTAVAVPRRSGNRILGVLALYGRRSGDLFGPDEVHLLQSLVRQAETAIENTFLYEEATRLSITDGLTGLWNRRLFDLRLSEELQRAIRFQEPFGLILIDLDHFKAVNDRFGHQAGDAVLVEVARRLTDATREVDVVTRFGGEEFALLLPKTPVVGTMRLANKVREVVAEQPFAAGDVSIPLTVSVGAACYPEHGLSGPELVAAADAALYRAKANGRDRVEEAEAGGRAAVRGAGAGR
ncbi:MAG: diguanylate cyclase with sensor [Acidimicrobiales bacterium]|nr:diguanylate cyclase with sensor [Acidimicrobiales bacterium]